MQNKDNFRTSKDDGDSVGKKDNKRILSDKPAPKEAEKESENTPPENEIYVDLEPDELHLSDKDEVEEVDVSKKNK